MTYLSIGGLFYYVHLRPLCSVKRMESIFVDSMIVTGCISYAVQTMFNIILALDDS